MKFEWNLRGLALACGLLALLSACGVEEAPPLPATATFLAVDVTTLVDGVGEGHHVEVYVTCDGEPIAVSCSPVMGGKTRCTFTVDTYGGTDRKCEIEVLEVDGDGTVLREGWLERLTLSNTTPSPHDVGVWNLAIEALNPKVRGLEIFFHEGYGQVKVMPPPQKAPRCDPARIRCVYDYPETAVEQVGVREKNEKETCVYTCEKDVLPVNLGAAGSGRRRLRLHTNRPKAGNLPLCLMLHCPIRDVRVGEQ